MQLNSDIRAKVLQVCKIFWQKKVNQILHHVKLKSSFSSSIQCRKLSVLGYQDEGFFEGS